MTTTNTPRRRGDSLLNYFVGALSEPDRSYYDHYELTTRDDYLKVFHAMKEDGYGAILVKEVHQLNWSHPTEITQALFDDEDEARDEMHYELGSMLENDSSVETVKMSVDSLDATATINDDKIVNFTIYSLTGDDD